MKERAQISKADRERAVAEYEAFIAHLHTDLPDGPPDPMDEMRGLVTLSTAEFRRRASIGKAMVDGFEAARKRDELGSAVQLEPEQY